MSYEMRVHFTHLTIPPDKKEMVENAETYLDWLFTNNWLDPGLLEPVDSLFNWDEDFIEDLKFLRSIGVRGQMVVQGEEGEYDKYVLDDESIKMFRGVITYQDEPNEEPIFRTFEWSLR